MLRLKQVGVLVGVIFALLSIATLSGRARTYPPLRVGYAPDYYTRVALWVDGWLPFAHVLSTQTYDPRDVPPLVLASPLAGYGAHLLKAEYTTDINAGYDLFLAQPNGTKRLVAYNVVGETVRWSADGETLYFRALENENYSLYFINTYTGAYTRIMPYVGGLYCSEFDVRWCVFPRYYRQIQVGALPESETTLLDLNTRETTQLAANPDGGLVFAWSPTAAQLVYNVPTPNGQQLILRDFANDSSQILLEEVVTRFSVPGVHWSPDGQWLALIPFASREDVPNIFLLNVHSGEIVYPQGLGGGLVGLVDWAADSSRLIFVQHNPIPQIYTLQLDGAVKQLTDHTEVSYYIPNYQPAWSADGTLIAYLAQHDNGTARLYRVPIDGSAAPTEIRLPLRRYDQLRWDE